MIEVTEMDKLILAVKCLTIAVGLLAIASFVKLGQLLGWWL